LQTLLVFLIIIASLDVYVLIKSAVLIPDLDYDEKDRYKKQEKGTAGKWKSGNGSTMQRGRNIK